MIEKRYDTRLIMEFMGRVDINDLHDEEGTHLRSIKKEIDKKKKKKINKKQTK